MHSKTNELPVWVVVMEVCILNTVDIFKAQLAQSKLESYGILCELRTNDAGGMLPHLRYTQGAEIYISEKDTEKAQEILKNFSQD